jgi:hypothetical protein
MVLLVWNIWNNNNFGQHWASHVKLCQGVWYYSTEFFTQAGLPNPLAGSLLSSVIFMFATLASVPLIEKAQGC